MESIIKTTNNNDLVAISKDISFNEYIESEKYSAIEFFEIKRKDYKGWFADEYAFYNKQMKIRKELRKKLSK